MLRATSKLMVAVVCACCGAPAGATTVTFFDSSQIATTVNEGVTSDTISSEGYLFTYTRDKLFTGGLGMGPIGRSVLVPWPQGVEAQSVTAGPNPSKAKITIQRVDGDVFDLTAFTGKLLANTFGAGGAWEVVPFLNGEEVLPDPVTFDASGSYSQTFSYSTAPNPLGSTAALTGYDKYTIDLYVDFALVGLTLEGARSRSRRRWFCWRSAQSGWWRSAPCDGSAERGRDSLSVQQEDQVLECRLGTDSIEVIVARDGAPIVALHQQLQARTAGAGGVDESGRGIGQCDEPTLLEGTAKRGIPLVGRGRVGIAGRGGPGREPRAELRVNLSDGQRHDRAVDDIANRHARLVEHSVIAAGITSDEREMGDGESLLIANRSRLGGQEDVDDGGAPRLDVGGRVPLPGRDAGGSLPTSVLAFRSMGGVLRVEIASQAWMGGR